MIPNTPEPSGLHNEDIPPAKSPGAERLFNGLWPFIPLIASLILIFSGYRAFFLKCSGDITADREKAALSAFLFLWGLYAIWDRYFFKDRNRRKTVLYTIIWVLTVFIAIESAIGLFDRACPGIYIPSPKLLWKLRPGLFNVPADNGRYRVSTDRESFRTAADDMGRSPFEGRKDNEVRVLITGDSAAFGWPLDYERTFAFYLQDDLKKVYPGKNVRIYNGAVCGYSSLQGLVFLRESGWKVKPDLLIIAFNNDPFSEKISDEERMHEKKLLPLLEILYRSRIYLMIRELVKGESLGPEKTGYGENSGVPRVSLSKAREVFDEMLTEAGKGKVQTVVTSMPVSGRTRDYPGLSAYRIMMRETADKHGAVFLDFFSHDEKWRDLMSDSLHPTGEGHRIIAREISAAVKKMKEENGE